MILQTAENQPALWNAIRFAMAYADIFDYPLTGQEIHRYLPGCTASYQAVMNALRTGSDIQSRANGLYTLPGREYLVETRSHREQVSAQLWPRAVRYGLLIARLPLVRMVAVTGALAVNNVLERADVDLLIVTEPGRLWLCRALVLLVARLAALQGIILCPNYLISLRAMEFPDQTLYAAHEVAQMIPLSGIEIYDQIRRHNGWVDRFLPNAIGAPPAPVAIPYVPRRSFFKQALEVLLSTPPFSLVERWEMDRKIRKLHREQGTSPESGFSADYCKGHAHRHQTRTQMALEERLRRLHLELAE